MTKTSFFKWVWMGLIATGCNQTSEPNPQPTQTRQVSAPQAPKPPSKLEQLLIDSGLVDIQNHIPGIRVDLKYSTLDNFVHKDLYGELDKCYLRPEAAQKLKRAQALLQTMHPDYSLVVFDGARPHHIQKAMWDSLDIPFKRNYLAPPWEGSVHNYGYAVDLSIVDGTGKELDMGTPFDFFGPESQPKEEPRMLKSGKLDSTQISNRKLLRKVMREAGFLDIQTEWWHFNAIGSTTVKKKFSRIP
jgi:D-alanyl-D-alanine dipeptidase